MIDVIIPAYTVSKELRKITERMIYSLFESEPRLGFNIIIIESGELQDYEMATVYKYPGKEPFNYNKALNYGMCRSKGEAALLCNNDLIFTPGSVTEMLEGFERGYGSISPYCPLHHKGITRDKYRFVEGYGVGGALVGWCIAVLRETFNKILMFDESVDFWYSDHIYAEQLKDAGIKHALAMKAEVKHLGSQTLGTLDPDQYFDVTVGQKRAFDEYMLRNNKNPERYHNSLFKLGK